MPIGDPLLYDVLKTGLTFLGGLLAAFIGQQAAKRNAKAAEKTSQLEHALRPLESANAAWERLLAPMETRIDDLQKQLDEMKTDQREREGILMRAISLLVSYATWIDGGAMPPPPDIPEWVRKHMTQAIKDIQED